jgi:hypothetical protein
MGWMRLSPPLAAFIGLLALEPEAVAAPPFPNRAAVEAALNAHEARIVIGNEGRHTPLRYRLNRARCESLGEDPINPGRILCIYWGSIRDGRDVIPIRHDCAYFRPARAGGWEVAAYPDADMCE